MVKYQSEFVWPAKGDDGSKFKVEVTYDDLRFAEFYNVNAAVTTDDASSNNETVAVLKGALLRRPQACFYEEADAVSPTLQEVSIAFCDSDGTASRVKHPKLVNDPCVKGGGLFKINTVEVKASHKGNDLGLRLLHEVLVLLQHEWTLTVMIPGALGTTSCYWPENGSKDVEQLDEDEEELSAEQKTALKDINRKIQKQFSRMGFVQAGRDPDLVNKWFLTSTMYFGCDITTATTSTESHTAMDRWLSKEDVISLDILEAPEKHEPTGLDKELSELCQGYDFPSEDAKARIEDLVKQGASIDGARALHICSSIEMEDNFPIQLLIELGGKVNFQDEYGNTPLHVAASQMTHRNIASLLAAGADTTITNMVGETPVQSLKGQLRSYGDMSAVFGLQELAPQEVDVIPKLESLIALMPPEQRETLRDGWMSPRMHCILTITAEIESDGMIDGQFLRGEYIPTDIKRANEPRQVFRDAWSSIWKAIKEILHTTSETPTVTRVQEYLESGKAGEEGKKQLEAYLAAEGKIEFALDALLGVTENVVVHGDDGWSYSDYKENIESIPTTDVDDAFDVAFVMCISKGGGDLEMRGPHDGGYGLATGLDESYSQHH
jgi:hypothetical protein